MEAVLELVPAARTMQMPSEVSLLPKATMPDTLLAGPVPWFHATYQASLGACQWAGRYRISKGLIHYGTMEESDLHEVKSDEMSVPSLSL